MSYRSAIKRYLIIYEYVKTNKNCSGEEIIERIEEEGINSSQSTLKRDLKALSDEFGIVVRFNFTTKGYQYYEDESTDYETFVKIIELISTSVLIQETIKENKENLQYISFDTSSQLKGIQNLTTILKAIKDCYQIQFTHRSFYHSVASTKTIEPYGLKEYANRWYVIGKSLPSQNIRTFGIDRMEEIEILKTKFKRPKVNPMLEFENVIGLVYSIHPSQKVVLSFSKQQGNYIKTLPIHTSQKITIDTEEELRIELFLKPNLELIQRIMMYGDEVSVIEPQWLADEIKQKLNNALKKYK
jgi:predicted DNA-binding transcriptional regulator YafY